MIIAIDCETKGLNTKEFLLGCICFDDMKKEFYYNKRSLWERILKLGKKESKQKKKLYVYAHNHLYDFLTYADYLSPQIKVYSHNRPFILAYQHEGKEIISFLDTMNIYPRSLKEVGETIKHEKLEMPEELTKENKKWTKEEIKELEKYCGKDTEIVMKFIQKTKEKLKEENVNVRRLITTNQIAISNFMNKIRQEGNNEHIIKDEKRNEIHWTECKDEIHEAYRGAKVEAFKTGKYKNVTAIDKINLYGYCSTKIRFPDLRTEKKIYSPKKEKLEEIGISKVIMEKKNNKLPILPIRMKIDGKVENYYPRRKGNIIIGTYTNKEIRYALKNGYEMKDHEWTITYKEGKNPFKKIIKELYKKRKTSKEEYDKWFYKQMMNSIYGKMAQRRTYKIYKYDSVDKYEQYIKAGWEAEEGFQTTTIYSKEQANKPKSYYCPIIPTLINAEARITMHEEMKKIPEEDLLYTDTDSIIFKGNHKSKYEIKDELGKFKIEKEEEEIEIKGKKMYKIGENIKFSGVPRKSLTKESFQEGKIKYTQLINPLNAKEEEEIGLFKEITINMEEIQENQEKKKYIMENRKLYKDEETILTTRTIKKLKEIAGKRN